MPSLGDGFGLKLRSFERAGSTVPTIQPQDQDTLDRGMGRAPCGLLREHSRHRLGLCRAQWGAWPPGSKTGLAWGLFSPLERASWVRSGASWAVLSEKLRDCQGGS